MLLHNSRLAEIHGPASRSQGRQLVNAALAEHSCRCCNSFTGNTGHRITLPNRQQHSWCCLESKYEATILKMFASPPIFHRCSSSQLISQLSSEKRGTPHWLPASQPFQASFLIPLPMNTLNLLGLQSPH